MARFKSKLDHVRVAAPCNVDWDNMAGNDRQRFCGQCQMNVYNLSDMTRAEAEYFVGNAEGRVCIRYFRRRDGSIITNNCPVGLRALKRRMTRMGHAFASALLMFLGSVGIHYLVERVRIAIGPNIVGEITGVMAVKEPPVAFMGDMPAVAGKMVPIQKRPVKIKNRVRTAER